MLNIVTLHELNDYRADSHVRKEMKIDFIRRVLAGETIYVRLEGPTARAGTIGIADFSEDEYLLTETQFNAVKAGNTDGLSWFNARFIDEAETYRDFLEFRAGHFDEFKLRMDDGKLISPPSFWADNSFSILYGYEGPTVKMFKKVSKAERAQALAKVEPTFTDKFGVLVQPGMLVSICIGSQLDVGVVTALTATGNSVYVRINDGDEPKLISMSSKIIVIDDKLKSRMMVKKLTK